MKRAAAEKLIEQLLQAHAVSIEEHEYSETEVIENDERFSGLRAEVLQHLAPAIEHARPVTP